MYEQKILVISQVDNRYSKKGKTLSGTLKLLCDGSVTKITLKLCNTDNKRFAMWRLRIRMGEVHIFDITNVELCSYSVNTTHIENVSCVIVADDVIVGYANSQNHPSPDYSLLAIDTVDDQKAISQQIVDSIQSPIVKDNEDVLTNQEDENELISIDSTNSCCRKCQRNCRRFKSKSKAVVAPTVAIRTSEPINETYSEVIQEINETANETNLLSNETANANSDETLSTIDVNSGESISTLAISTDSPTIIELSVTEEVSANSNQTTNCVSDVETLSTNEPAIVVVQTEPAVSIIESTEPTNDEPLENNEIETSDESIVESDTVDEPLENNEIETSSESIANEEIETSGESTVEPDTADEFSENTEIETNSESTVELDAVDEPLENNEIETSDESIVESDTVDEPLENNEIETSAVNEEIETSSESVANEEIETSGESITNEEIEIHSEPTVEPNTTNESFDTIPTISQIFTTEHSSLPTSTVTTNNSATEPTDYEKFIMATENYYQKESVMRSIFAPTSNASSNAPDTSRQAINEYADSFDRFYSLSSFGYYASVKDELVRIFNSFPTCTDLTQGIPNSVWAKIDCRGREYFALGLIMERDKPKYICYALPRTDQPYTDKYQNIDVGGGYVVISQDATTGRVVTKADLMTE